VVEPAGMIMQLIKVFLTALFESRMGIEPVSGKFRVMYNDGRVSQRMWYFTACDYAKIFKGKVILHNQK
jgi:hypothetical protein